MSTFHSQFRDLCRQHDLAATHQREVIFSVITAHPGHYSPEQVYAQVRKRLPNVSLATVYKNLNKFVELGLLRQVHSSSGAMRVDGNSHAHHHLRCKTCKT